ncbi:MAG: bifunctional folylpolyglutamate synthase/dihydrofolate synthase [Mycobacteriales bacterium]
MRDNGHVADWSTVDDGSDGDPDESAEDASEDPADGAADRETAAGGGDAGSGQPVQSAESIAREMARVEAELSTRWPESRIDPTLDRIAALVDLLGAPHRAVPVIHLTGTNGKTSTARMVDTLLGTFGLRVGRLTSPHLASVTERISIDGEPVSEQRFVELYDDVAPILAIVDAHQPVPLSYFEVLTAMAFVAFADTPFDVAVLEVGMGGRWDSTNVADGQVAVITPISLEHTRYLGTTTEAIAGEKAGIIKPDATAILARQDPGAAGVLVHAAAAVGAAVAREGLEFGVLERRAAIDGQMLRLQGVAGTYEDVFLPLYGAHQAQNAACALAAVEVFLGAGADRGIDPELVRTGFAAVTSPGRLETVASSPTVLVDASHNPGGMAVTVEAVRESFAFRRLIGVVAMVVDKDVPGVLTLLEPVLDAVVVTENSSHRAQPVEELAESARLVFGDERVYTSHSLAGAIEDAVRLAAETDDPDLAGAADTERAAGTGVLVTGSVITAGEARTLLGGGR